MSAGIEHGGRVAVLGAGLQGACVALELAARGFEVDLFDRHPDSMMGASLNNEGKVHLGFVYGNDRSLRTAETMVEGAATFAPLLERWLETPMSSFPISTPFNYAVHRDSMLSVEEVESHLERAHDAAVERIRGGEYFGIDLGPSPSRLTPSELDAAYDPALVLAAYRTSEVGIEPVAFAALVRARIQDDPKITPRFSTEVLGVNTASDRPEVRSSINGATEITKYGQVVNALWDGRLGVDATAGATPPRPWLYRVKYFLRVESLIGDVPSTTVVLGPFGDIANYAGGRYYLSWYPIGLQGSSGDLELPADLRLLRDEMASVIREGIVAGLRSIAPGLGRISAAEVDGAEISGGVIFAWGETDIDDAESELHQRFAIGPASHGRYHTIDTGKLTMAPLFARETGQRISSMR